jgi:hypothetical protein
MLAILGTFMVIFIQHTITDLRPFTEESGGLLPIPSWPIPNANREFVKGAGLITERLKKGLDNWIGENTICKINKGIRITDKIVNKKSTYKLVGKHQFSTENFVLSKFEFIFACKSVKYEGVYWNRLEPLIKDILNVETKIKIGPNREVITTLNQIGGPLKKYHLFNSTYQSVLNPDVHLTYLYNCTPQIYVSVDRNGDFYGPYNQFTPTFLSCFTRKTLSECRLYTALKTIGGIPVRLWIHSIRNEDSPLSFNRKLRISILRLHSEYECLKNVLTAIRKNLILINGRSKSSDNLQSYLNNTIKTILKEEKNIKEYSERDFLETFKNMFFQFKPGELEFLRNKIQSFNFRPQIEGKTINYIETLITMNENYNISNSQVGAVGSHAHSDNNSFQQIDHQFSDSFDYLKLEKELTLLKETMKLKAKTSEDFEAVQHVAKAEELAIEHDGSNALKYLKAAGKWAFDTATKVGVNLVCELLKSNNKLP